MYKCQAAILLVHHRQSRSLERKRLEGVLTDTYEGWKLRHTGQETIDESAVPRLIALLTIPAEGIPLNAGNYWLAGTSSSQLPSALLIPLSSCPHLGLTMLAHLILTIFSFQKRRDLQGKELGGAQTDTERGKKLRYTGRKRIYGSALVT